MFFKDLKNNQIARTGFKKEEMTCREDAEILFEGFENLFALHQIIEKFLGHFTVQDKTDSVVSLNNNTVENRWIKDQKMVRQSILAEVAV